MREIDVQALQEEMQVGYWELVNGEDTVYRDSRGNVYDSWGCLERLRELEMMILSEGLDNIFYERAFERLIPQGYSFYVMDTTEFFSAELDTVEDFQQAQKLIPASLY